MQTLYAATRGGTRYHRHPECHGLTSTQLAGDPIPPVTRAAALARGLTPCALCDPPQIAHLAVVA